MDVGDERMAARDFRGALAAYSAADEIVGVPTTGIEVGRAQQALGLWIEARDTWIRVARYPKQREEPKPFTEARSEAEQLALSLGARMPTLLIDVEPVPELALLLDQRQLASNLVGVPLRVNPGTHRVEATAPGYEPTTLEVSVVERATRTVRVALVRRPPPTVPPSGAEQDERRSSPGSPAAMWIGFGVAAAGTAVGTGLGLWAFDQTARLHEECGASPCPEELAGEIDRAKTTGALSTVSFALGAAGLGVGVWQAVALLTGKDRTSQASGPSYRRHGWAVFPHGPGGRVVYTLRFP